MNVGPRPTRRGAGACRVSGGLAARAAACRGGEGAIFLDESGEIATFTCACSPEAFRTRPGRGRAVPYAPGSERMHLSGRSRGV